MSKPRPAHDLYLPPDLNLAIVAVLSFHLGRGNPISPANLCAALRELNLNERQLRARIELLRYSGHLIGSIGGEDGGYYLITTQEELEDFLDSEYRTRIDDMRQTMEAMTKAASQRWGFDAIQRIRF